MTYSIPNETGASGQTSYNDREIMGLNARFQAIERLLELDTRYHGLGLPGQIAALSALLGGIYGRSTRFVSISSGTSGTLTPPAASSIILDDFGGTVDAVVAALSGGRPTHDRVLTSSGAIVAATLDSLGNWSLSGTPAYPTYPIALIYRVRQKLTDYNDTDSDILGSFSLEN